MDKSFKNKTGLILVFCLLATVSVQAQNTVTEHKIDSLISRMTLAEKVHMIHASSSFTSGGDKRLGIPELVMSDGPHGVRYEHGRGWTISDDPANRVTYLPTGITLASTWNPKLAYSFGRVLGSEAKYRGKDMILGPAINIIRTPLNGRNFEYMSEDPFLVSQMAVQYIKGVQDQGIAACVKHYIANNQETNRTTVDVSMSDRAFHEIYLPGFKAAVQQGDVLAVMGSYNKFRGQYATENAFLVNMVLKDQLGFKRVLVSDWGAVHNTMEALLNGTDIEMGTDLSMLPNPDYNKFFMGDTVVTLVRNGQVPESVVDDKVRRILRVMFAIHKFGHHSPGAINTADHQETALKIAEEGIVLLKNKDHLLPLDTTNVKTIAVIGANADIKFASGGGSSQVPAKFEITPLEGLRQLVGNKVSITYASGYKNVKDFDGDPQLIEQAVAVAKSADAVIYVGGWTHGYNPEDFHHTKAYDAESVDKPNLQLPFAQDTLIKSILHANPNTVMVLMGGGPVDMNQWIGQAKSIVQAWYPGMEGGTALAKIIFGQVNPSGKLPMTFPKKLTDTPAQTMGEYPGKNLKEHYNEGIFVGYRYYDAYDVTPQFCFGHGLSYTTFKYSDLKIMPGDHMATVELTVTNTGRMAGKEVVQVYVHDESTPVRMPEKQLKAFKKISLQPGESKKVVLVLSQHAFEYYSGKDGKWEMPNASFDILVGSSSRDIRLKGPLQL